MTYNITPENFIYLSMKKLRGFTKVNGLASRSEILKGDFIWKEGGKEAVFVPDINGNYEMEYVPIRKGLNSFIGTGDIIWKFPFFMKAQINAVIQFIRNVCVKISNSFIS